MNRQILRELAEERARDAWALLYARQWSGAYYLAGYAVECGLKACISRLTHQDDYPDKKFAHDCFTHNLAELVKLARLEDQRKIRVTVAPNFGANWLIVKDWNEQTRYHQHTESAARKLFEAVTDSTSGVLPWIKTYW